MDLRCHGDSPQIDIDNSMKDIAEDIYSTLQANNLSISTVVGHSFGGKIALEMMRCPPSSLHNAIILDISLIF